MYPRSHRVAKRRIDCLMTFDESFALERVGYNDRLEMVAAAGGIANFYMSAGHSEFDQSFNLLRIHCRVILARDPPSIPPLPALANKTTDFPKSGLKPAVQNRGKQISRW